MNIATNWKELSTPYMRWMLNRGIRKVKRNKIKVGDGYFVNLIDYTNPKTKWKYQVEYLRDSRFYDKAHVVVYAFNPKISGCERADYYLHEK